MGCDIHCYAEVRKDDKWERVKDKVFPNMFHRPEIIQKSQEMLDELKAIKNPTEDEIDRIEYLESDFDFYDEYSRNPYRGRNYDTFAILADVRNGYGFAGCDTGKGFNIISEPKGLPGDVTEEVKAASDKWGCDGHSHSWLTVKEMLDFDWDQIATKRGVLHIDAYESWMEETGGKMPPNSYSGGVAGKNLMTLKVEDYYKYKEANQLDPDITYFVRAEWTQTYRSTSTFFVEKTIPALQSLGDPEDVRLVFWFDN